MQYLYFVYYKSYSIWLMLLVYICYQPVWSNWWRNILIIYRKAIQGPGLPGRIRVMVSKWYVLAGHPGPGFFICIDAMNQWVLLLNATLINPVQGIALRWRHNELDGVSNHQPHDCLLNRLFGHRSKKTSKLRVTGLCARNSQGTGEFPAQMASNAENVSIWWRHHGYRFHWVNATLIAF